MNFGTSILKLFEVDYAPLLVEDIQNPLSALIDILLPEVVLSRGVLLDMLVYIFPF